MYTHTGGYKFCIGVDANGSGLGRGISVNLAILAMTGEYENWLKWPARVDFTIKLVNQCGGCNVKSGTSCRWEKQTSPVELARPQTR